MLKRDNKSAHDPMDARNYGALAQRKTPLLPDLKYLAPYCKQARDPFRLSRGSHHKKIQPGTPKHRRVHAK